MGCRLVGGLHAVKAEFGGDGSFGPSKNITKFSMGRYNIHVNVVNARLSDDDVIVSVEVTDEQGYPLIGKSVSGKIAGKAIYAATDSQGISVLKLKDVLKRKDLGIYNESILINVRKDRFAEGFELDLPLSAVIEGFASEPSTCSIPTSTPVTDYLTMEQGPTIILDFSSPAYTFLPLRIRAWLFNGSIGPLYTFEFSLDKNTSWRVLGR